MRTYSDIVLILLLNFLCSQCRNNTSNNQIKEQQISFIQEGTLTLYNHENQKIATLNIEIADTPYELETGLMYRNSLEEQNGMLFIFDNDQMRNFYMKNTLIPLDLLFIDQNFEILHLYSNAEPYSTESISSQFPVKYVFEISGGLSSKLGIQKGMKIKYTKS